LLCKSRSSRCLVCIYPNLAKAKHRMTGRGLAPAPTAGTCTSSPSFFTPGFALLLCKRRPSPADRPTRDMGGRSACPS
jgi:hypothetical protein